MQRSYNQKCNPAQEYSLYACNYQLHNAEQKRELWLKSETISKTMYETLVEKEGFLSDKDREDTAAYDINPGTRVEASI